MNFQAGKSRRTGIELNLTPLIDIVFNLLIFFLITSTFVQNPGIEVNLPKASDAPVDAESDSVIIALTSEGRVIHEGDAVSTDELIERLSKHHERRPQSMVVIQADSETHHGKVVELMDLARKAGFSQLAIATEADQ